jgi:hypothetical protein
LRAGRGVFKTIIEERIRASVLHKRLESSAGDWVSLAMAYVCIYIYAKQVAKSYEGDLKVRMKCRMTRYGYGWWDVIKTV